VDSYSLVVVTSAIEVSACLLFFLLLSIGCDHSFAFFHSFAMQLLSLLTFDHTRSDLLDG
jgi:hypothetical protein